jgi:transglutaminase-like putative cysteine protease
MASPSYAAPVTPPHLAGLAHFSTYALGTAYDEMFDGQGQPRPQYEALYDRLRASADGPADSAIATHAWLEVLLPELGWVGFDPTHDVTAGERHVRVAIGRDYADVPPTRGTFKGITSSTLAVSAEVTPAEALPTLDPAVIEAAWSAEAAPVEDARERQMQQQQQ